jgi:glucan phosphorylase
LEGPSSRKLKINPPDISGDLIEKHKEASGTSGMKAALNGVSSLSVLDGWWIEGHLERVTGRAIGQILQDESDH